MNPAQLKSLAKKATASDTDAMEELVLQGPQGLDGMDPAAFAKRVMEEDGYAEKVLGVEATSDYARGSTKSKAEQTEETIRQAGVKSVLARLELAGLDRAAAMAAAKDIVEMGKFNFITEDSVKPPEGETVLGSGSNTPAGA